jgi:hypothetical protein
MPFHLRKFSGVLLVAGDKERRGPENDDCGRQASAAKRRELWPTIVSERRSIPLANVRLVRYRAASRRSER